MRKIVTTNSPLLNSQFNEILILVNGQNLDSSEFEWVLSESSFTNGLYISKLIHKPTDYFFIFDLNQGNHYCIFSPGKEKLKDSNYPGSWELQTYYFNE